MLLFLVFVVGAASAREAPKNESIEIGFTKCYDELGCFTTGGDFWDPLFRGIDLLPLDRSVINVRFMIYTRKHPKTFTLQRAIDVKHSNLKNLGLNPKVDTKIITHGYLDNSLFGTWMQVMKDEFLKSGDCNVVITEWSGGNLPPYTQAAADSRLVGAEIANFINSLKSAINLDPKRVHLVGHSLGAHAMGYAGERIKNLGRITGLDPAGPMFEMLPPKVRLDPTDAQFVDAIHSDTKSQILFGLGMNRAVGHVDFYPNGAELQPGCAEHKWSKFWTDGFGEGFRGFFACNHLRSIDYFLESINSACNMVGNECSDWSSYLSGKCASCGSKGERCAILGIKADRFKSQTKTGTYHRMYLKTNDISPFCRKY